MDVASLLVGRCPVSLAGMKSLCILGFLLLSLLPRASWAQQDTLAFYPRLTVIKTVPGRVTFQHNSLGCLAGDCKEGAGTFVRIGTFWPNTNDTPQATLNIYRGTFSQAGMRFSGRIHHATIRYTKEGDHKVGFTLTPDVENPDFGDEAFLASFLVYEGEAAAKANQFTKAIEDYWPDGKGTERWVPRVNPSVASFSGTFKDGYPLWAEIAYDTASTMRSFRGYVRYTGEPLYGLLTYTSGDTFEGFLLSGKPHGPGVATSKTKKTSGVWTLGTLSERRAVDLPASAFDVVASLDAPKVAYNILGGAHAGIQLGDQNKDGSSLIWTPDTLFFGQSKDGTAHGYAYFRHASPPRRVTHNSWPRGSETVAEGLFVAGHLHTGTNTMHRNVVKTTAPIHHHLPGSYYEVEDSLTTKGVFIGGDGCLTTYRTEPLPETTIARLANGGYTQGWVARLSDKGAVDAAWYMVSHANGVGFLTSKGDLTESDITAALADKSSCVPIATQHKKAFAERMRSIMELQQQSAALRAAAEARDKDRVKPMTAQDWADRECALRKKYLRQDTLRITMRNEPALVLDFDCMRNKYVMAVRKRAETYGRHYAPHHYLEVTLVDPNMERVMSTQQNHYRVCPACNGRPAGEQSYLSESWTWKPVLGLTWGVQVNKTERRSGVFICNTCRGEAWVRR
jgi:hypothetical protein